VYAELDGNLEFIRVEPPNDRDLMEVGRSLFQRFEAFLKREGYTEADAAEELDDVESWALQATQEPSLLNRGNLQVKRQNLSTTFGGFSIHAGVSIKANDRRGREKLVRYVSRPPFCEEQLSLSPDGRVLLELRSPTKTGQTHVSFEPVRFLRRLAWLVPFPGQNQRRYLGVFGPTHRFRSRIVPRPPELSVVAGDEPTPRYRVAWAKLLARVYAIDSEICPECKGRLRPVGAVTKKAEAIALLDSGLPVLGSTELHALDSTGPPQAA
jgi:Putative transposase.